MPQVVVDFLQRGGSGIGEFPVAREEDIKVSYLTVTDIAERDALPTWKLIPFMRVHVSDTDTDYRLGVSILTPVWTEITVSADLINYQLLSEKGQASGYAPLNAESYIDPIYIKSIYTSNVFVVADETERFGLSAQTGDIAHQLDTGEVFIKLNNDPPTTDSSDWANITPIAFVTSVNGMTGAVSIEIVDLLAWDNNQTQFNSAVSLTPAVLSNSSDIISNAADIAALYALLTSLPGLGLTAPIVNADEIALGQVGDSVTPSITGSVTIEDADTIDEIRYVRVVDGVPLQVDVPVSPGDPIQTLSFTDSALTVTLGVTRTYRIDVLWTASGVQTLTQGTPFTFDGVYPILYGNAATGLADLYTLNKLLKREGNTFVGITGTQRMYFAIPDTYANLVDIQDQHGDSMFGSLFSDTPATVLVNSSGLTSDWSINYKVYESAYDAISADERYGYLTSFISESIEIPSTGDMLKAVYDADNNGIVDRAKNQEITVVNASGVILSKGALVHVNGYSAIQGLLTVTRADRALGLFANGIMTEEVAISGTGIMLIKGVLEGMNTNGIAVDTILYLDTTGTYTATRPTSGIIQPVLLVSYEDLTTGVLYFDPSSITQLIYDSQQRGFADLSESQVVQVINNTGVTIAKDKLVAIAGYDAGSGKIEISLADQSTPVPAIGIMVQSLDDAEEGFIIPEGVAITVDTSGLTVGDTLFLSTSGDFTNTAPTTGLVQEVGYVMRVDPSNGKVKIDITDRGILTQENIISDAFGVTGGTSNKITHGPMLIVELTQSVTYTLPEISGLANTDYRIDLKNISGGVATIQTSGADTVEGDTSVNLVDGENITVYMKPTEYKIL